MKKVFYIGMMSGTSLDGVDVALCRINKTSCELVASETYPFPSDLKAEIIRMAHTPVTLSEAGQADHRLGVWFAEAVNHFLAYHAIDPNEVAAIGSHGQTVWHEPESRYPFSMQMGDPNIIAAQTGIKVVADFRRKDMAFGGSGAPFAPAFHKFIFKNIESSTVVANIGGIANITVLGRPLIGYDTGPGNMLMDAWIMQHKGVGYDQDGSWAQEGRVDYTLLDSMMEDPYFSKTYPKSTGRETFNLEWIGNSISRSGRSPCPPVDVQRTLLELTALSLSNEVLKFNPDMLMLCGGGAQNSFLVERIAALMPNMQVGVMAHSDALEAMMMAWLAYKRVHNEYIDLKDVTGAKQNTILGGVYV